MDTITLKGVIPKVFSDSTFSDSQVWASSLSLQRGTHYLIAAKSGAGKSSLCSFLLALRKDYEGTIEFDGKDVRTCSVKELAKLRRESFAYLPQDLSLVRELTSWENVLLKNKLTNTLSHEEIEELFSVLGLSDKRDTSISLLSIGQQQRVALIRTLCQKADFYLLDEPVSHLDSENNHKVGELFLRYAKRWGASVIATSVGYSLDFPFDTTILL